MNPCSDRPLGRISRVAAIGVLCLAAMTTPSQASDQRSSAARADQKLTILQQTATPNVLGRPAVYVDCNKCKGTVTLFTNTRKRRELGSGKFTKALSHPVGMSLVKLNSRGRELNKKTKVTVLAEMKVGKRSVRRKIGLRKPVSPCEVVKPAEIAVVMGEPADTGVEEKTALLKESDTRMCTFEASAKRPIVTPNVSVSLTRGYGAGGFKFLPVHYDAPGDLTPVSGVGKKAYFVNGLGEIGALHAIKSDTYLQISAPGSVATGRRPDLMPALANLVFARVK